MKKHFIISMALAIATTVALAPLANIETHVDKNQTEFNIKFKDITKNYKNAFDYWFRFEDEFDISYEMMEIWEQFIFDDMIIIIPDIETLDLKDKSSSSNPEDDDSYEVALTFDFEISFSITNNNGLDFTYERCIDGIWYLGHNDINGIHWSFDPEVINKNIGQIEGEDWIYDFSLFGEYFMKEFSFSSNNFNESIEEFSTWITRAPQLIISGYGEYPIKLIGMENIEIGNFEYGITKDYKKEISLYGRRFKNDDSWSNTSVIDDKYLIEIETFTQEDIDNAKLIDDNQRPNNNLSGGAIAGIVIGSIMGIVLIAGSIFWILRTKSNLF